MNSVKSIKFNLTLSGSGIVQTDHKEQKHIYNQCENATFAKNKYNTFAKANYYKNNEGKINRKVKISSDGLRHAIHIGGHDKHVQNIDTDELLVPYIASVDSVLRGYMIPGKEKKKSVYCITSAEIVNGAIPTLDVHLRSGKMDGKDEIDNIGNDVDSSKIKDNNKADNETDKNSGFFFRENIGDTVYAASGFVNIKDLRFISVCDVYDRRMVQDDDADDYIEALSKNINSSVPEIGYYNLKNSSYIIPERGIVLTDDNCRFLISSLFKKISNIMICKSCGGYAKAEKLEIELVSSFDSEPIKYTIFENGVYDDSCLNTVTFDNPFEESTFEIYNEHVDLITKNLEFKKQTKRDKKANKNRNNG